MPPCLYTPLCLYAPIHSYAPEVYMPPICPHSLLYLCVVLEALHVVRGCNELPFVLGYPPLHHSCLGMPPLNYTPHTQSLVPYASVCFRDINMLCWCFPSVEGFGGISPISWGLGASALEMSIFSFLYLFCSALCLTFQLWLQLLLLQLQWYLLACLPCHQ